MMMSITGREALSNGGNVGGHGGVRLTLFEPRARTEDLAPAEIVDHFR